MNVERRFCFDDTCSCKHLSHQRILNVHFILIMLFTICAADPTLKLLDPNYHKNPDMWIAAANHTSG